MLQARLVRDVKREDERLVIKLAVQDVISVKTSKVILVDRCCLITKLAVEHGVSVTTEWTAVAL